ncbi:MAG: PEP-CTERM sorting domain-containing protein [Thiobacillus sp.]|nr:PEP-CTERM sorting domain-containing protein [Thiobacillus sp.]
MKRVKTIQSFPLRSSLLLAALAMASAGAQASVTLTTGNHDLVMIRDAGAIEIRNAGGIELVSGGNISIQQPSPIVPPAVSLGNATASSHVSGNMNYSLGSSSGYFSESDYSADGSAVALALSRKGFGYQAEAAATGTQLKAHAETQWAQHTDSSGYSTGYGSSSAYATSNWSDWFVISGGTGLGTASFMAELNGKLQSTANGSANFGLTVAYSTNTYCYYWYNTCTAADQSQTLISQTTSLSGKSKSTLAQSVEGEFTFAYDTPFQLTASLNVGASNGGLADINFDTLSHILVLPLGVSLQSASGLYVQAVPEAETYAMMLAGLGLVGFAAARRELKQ